MTRAQLTFGIGAAAGGDKMRQGWTASRKQPGGRVPGIVPNLMRSPMAPSTPEAAAGLQGGGQGAAAAAVLDTRPARVSLPGMSDGLFVRLLMA